ncbi:hypothetical protein [Frankia sp. Cppng1_Ct_nod]|uniref:hypothetical protein n=1 Tax=Frankia sp. Cppng1_Ct_nod TaxID=2897162 RepID=UPI0020246BBE|nr:hypothetical protein [Frankia sp. Cppng1_Ct_nod]
MDAPATAESFDEWAVQDPASPLFREARYLLSEEPALRDSALYSSVLAAVAGGATTRGGIASQVGRTSADLAHPLTVLTDAGFLVRADDILRNRRPVWRIAEPLVAFYHALMRPVFAQLERRGRSARVATTYAHAPRPTPVSSSSTSTASTTVNEPTGDESTPGGLPGADRGELQPIVEAVRPDLRPSEIIFGDLDDHPAAVPHRYLQKRHPRPPTPRSLFASASRAVQYGQRNHSEQSADA